MTKIYSPEELNSFSRETLVAVILSMQDQLARAEYKHGTLLPRRSRLQTITVMGALPKSWM